MAIITVVALSRGGQQQPLPHRDTLSPQQVREWAIQQGRPGGGGSGGGGYGAGGAGQQRQPAHPDTLSPQHIHEWIVQRGRPGGGGYGFMSTGQQRQQCPQETFSLHRLRDCVSQRGVPGCVEAAALGASESAAAPGANESAAALGASASTATGPASAEALHTFTLDSDGSRCFFHDCTTVTPLVAPVPVSLADPSGGPVVARASTVLPCPAVPSGALSGPHLPSFLTNAVLQDALVDTFTPGGQRVSIFTCSRTGRHLATFTRQPGSSLYTLTTASAHVAAPGQVAASIQVSASGQLTASCSCRVLSHQTLLWHHHLGHPSLPRLRSMHSCLLVFSLPRSLPPLPRSLAPPYLPCVEGWQRAAPHSSSFPPTIAPLQTLHMDVWGPAPVHEMHQERYFLLVVNDYTRYTTVFPLRSKADVRGVLIPWILATRHQLRERFWQYLPVLRLHLDRGGEFSSDLLVEFCRDEGTVQSFTLPASPQQDGITEQTSPTLHWTGKVGDASADDTATTHRSPRLVTPPDFPPRPSSPPLQPVAVDTGAAGSGDSGGEVAGGAGPWGAQTGGADPRGAETGGEGSGGAESGSADSEGADSGGAASPSGGGAVGAPIAGPGVGQQQHPSRLETRSPQQLREWIVRRGRFGAGAWSFSAPRAAGPGGAGAVGARGTGGAASAGARGTGVTGGTGAASRGGARTRGARAVGAGGGAGVVGAGGATGAAGTGGGGGTAGAGGAGDGGTGGAGGANGGAGTGGARGTAGAGGARAGGTGGTRGAGAAGAGGTAGARGAGGATGAAGAGGAGVVCAGGTGAADGAGTAPRRPFFYPQSQSSLPPPDFVLRQVLSLPSSTGLSPPLPCPPTDQSQPQLLPGSPLPALAPHSEVTESLTERREPETRASTPVCAHRVARPRPPAVLGTHVMALRPCFVPQRVPLLSPPASSLRDGSDPASDLAHAASPTVTRLLTTVATDPDFESTAAFSLVTEIVEFAARRCLDYVVSFITESEFV
ncbi:unnamed protein product [Closterium sp. NIES-54]